MIAASPQYEFTHVEHRELEYLLLGDLRQILEEPEGPHTACWLLAILDMILVGRPRLRRAVYLPVRVPEDPYQPRTMETRSLIEKLRRLRDRVAHRAGHAALANEIRDELREVMLDRMSSAGCLFDA
ncbi:MULTISPECIES: hypothetical protein [unclassified Schlesneria]|uniref:hypothetical protein n=1 Tax=Schlesneria TaxID=656899 RepID=UPI002EE2448F